jgi:hypothetical protein
MGGSVVSHDKAAQSLSINPIFKKGGLCFFYNFVRLQKCRVQKITQKSQKFFTTACLASNNSLIYSKLRYILWQFIRLQANENRTVSEIAKGD